MICRDVRRSRSSSKMFQSSLWPGLPAKRMRLPSVETSASQALWNAAVRTRVRPSGVSRTSRCAGPRSVSPGDRGEGPGCSATVRVNTTGQSSPVARGRAAGPRGGKLSLDTRPDREQRRGDQKHSGDAIPSKLGPTRPIRWVIRHHANSARDSKPLHGGSIHTALDSNSARTPIVSRRPTGAGRSGMAHFGRPTPGFSLPAAISG